MSRKLLLILVWLLGGLSVSQLAQAQMQVTCQAPTINSINFGAVDWIGGGVMVGGMVSLSCTHRVLLSTLSVALCLNLDAGSGGGPSNFSPRLLGSGVQPDKLEYQVYDGGGTIPWGNINPGFSTPLKASLTIPYNQTVGVDIPFQARLTVPPWAPAGYYSSQLTINVQGAANIGAPSSCTGSTIVPVQTMSTSFMASATVMNRCVIASTTGINFGSRPSDAINTVASGGLSVSCNALAPYYIGLLPSNGNTAGEGVMRGSFGNTDLVPYRLSSSAGFVTPWGNTAGNGVAGTGQGTYSIFGIVPSTNYKPDTYKDNVTVNVNY